MNGPFENYTGRAAPLPAENINTDAIIPSAWLRAPTADLACGLFANWRFDAAGRERPDFVLNDRRFRGATVLFAGQNFGCGSSREAAAWALLGYGIRCVVAPSFSDIFYENACRNGLLPALISGEDLARAADAMMRDQREHLYRVDLPAATITSTHGHAIRFSIPDFRREALLRGEDDIAATLRLADEIRRFADTHRADRPWLYAPLQEGPPR